MAETDAVVETLLAPVDGDDPAGVDLEYDPSISEITSAIDDAPIDAAEAGPLAPEFRRHGDALREALTRSKDMRLATYLACAGALGDRLDDVEIGLKLLRGLARERWDASYPKLEEGDEEFGLTARGNLLMSLDNLRCFLGPLMRVTLVEDPRAGKFSAQDALNLRDGNGEVDANLFLGAMANAGPEALEPVHARAQGVRQAFEEASAALDEKGAITPALKLTAKHLTDFVAGAAYMLERGGGSAPEPDASSPDASGARAAAPAQRGLAGQINSRDEVEKALDLILAYYRRAEPASVVPFLVERAKRLVHADFMETVQDIDPDRVFEIKDRLGLRDED